MAGRTDMKAVDAKGNQATAIRSPQPLYGVQMLRATAALAVVIHHALENSNGSPGRFSPDWLTTAGACGVDLFFVVSGFIMIYVSFAHSRPLDARSFLFRRATRIYPTYWVCCLITLVISGAGFLSSHSWSFVDVLASLLLLPTDHQLISVAWTLVYEIYFYAIFAATLPLKSIGFTATAATASIVGFFLMSHALPVGRLQAFLANPIPLEFCMGLWLGFGFVARGTRSAAWPVPIACGLVGICLLVAAPLFVPHQNTSGLSGLLRVLAWGIPAVLVLASFLGLGPPKSAAGRLLVLLGDASYALYLTHVFVMIGYGRLIKTSAIGGWDQIYVVPCVVALSAAVAALFYLRVERPTVALAKTLFRRRSDGSCRAQ
jgi:exopolysaccharide production protein ExoZ